MKRLFTLLLCVVLVMTLGTTAYATELNGMQSEELSEEEMTYVSDLLTRFGLSSGDNQKEVTESAVTTSAPIVYATDEELIAEGKALFDKFVETISFTETDSTWEYCFMIYDGIIRSTYIETYMECVKGASKEQLANMTAYEVLVYADTYLRFASMANAANNVSVNSYILNGEKGVNNLLKEATGSWTGNNSEEVIAAYEEFLNWQVEYYRTYNFPYNFITGRSYAEEMSSTYTVEPSQEATGDITAEEMQEFVAELESEDIEEIKQELKNEGIIVDEELEEVIAEEKEPGIWDEVFESLKDSWFTLGLLVVLVVAYLVVRFIRTRRAVDEMTDEGK